jgi:hypothetical protein
MAYDYGNDQWFGSEYKRALQNGDQAYAASLQAKMDANPHPYSAPVAAVNAAQVGMINAKTADMGRGTNVFANGGNGMEYNTTGQMRTPGLGATNSMYGPRGYAVNPGQAQQGLLSGIGQFAATPTNTQYSQAPTSYTRGPGVPYNQGMSPQYQSYQQPQMPSQPRNYVQQPYQNQGYGQSYGNSYTSESRTNPNQGGNWRGATPQYNQPQTFGGGGYGGTGFSMSSGYAQPSVYGGGVTYRRGLLK